MGVLRFVSRTVMVEDGDFFVLRSQKIEELPPSSKDPPIFEEVALPPLSPVRSSDHYSRPKIEDGGFYDPRGRRSKIQEDRRSEDSSKMRGFFEEGSSSNMGSLKIGVLRRWVVYDLSAPENEEPVIFVRQGRKIVEPPPFSFFGAEDRRTSHLRSSE